MNPLDAARELRASWSRWRELGQNIDQWETTARARYQDALAREDDAAMQGALVAWVQVRELRQEYEQENARWRWAAAIVPFLAPDSGAPEEYTYAPGTALTGLGAVPVLWPLGLAAVAGTVVSLALAVRAVFRKATAAERVMAQLARGDLTEEEARRLLNALPDEGGPGFGTVMALGLVAVLVALAGSVRR